MLSQSTHIENFNKYPIWLLPEKSAGAVSMCTPFNKPKSGTIIMEIWKDIKGYEGYYQISNLGRVKSLNRVILYKDKRRTPVKERLLIVRIRGLYYCVDLSKNCSKKQIRLHRLLALTFIPNPNSKPEINHKDGNKLNNNLDNLEWCTHKENMAHAYENNLSHSGENCLWTNLTNEKVREIRSKYIPYKYPCSKLAKEYNLSEGTVYYIVTYRNWKRI